MVDGNKISAALNSYFNEKGIKQIDIANKLGVSKAYVNSLFTGSRPFGKKQAEIWEREFGISRSFLLTGEGEMFNRELEGNAHPVSIDAINPIIEVRYFEVSPSATFQEFLSDVSEAASTIDIPAIPGENIDDSYCVFQAYGDSMLPRIPNHARILCKEIKPTRWHELRDCVIVIAYADKFVIKRLARNNLDTDNCIILASDNPEYPEQHTVALNDIRCIFRALHIINAPIS